MVSRTALFLLALNFFSIANCSNILLVPLSGVGSHYQVMLNVAKELLHRGHNITMLVTDLFAHENTPSNNPIEGAIHFIFFPTAFTMDEYLEIMTNMTTAGLQGRYVEWLMEITTGENNFQQKMQKECENLLANQGILSILGDSNVDLVVADMTGGCPIHQYLRKNNGIPYVALSAVLTIPGISIIANRASFNPAYMPEITSGLGHVMSFTQRLKNVGTSLLFTVLFNEMTDPNREVRIQHGLTNITIFCEDAELILINTNFVLDFPRPFLPNTKAVGGLTVAPGRPLAVEWIDFLESAGEDGVVLFSMGSYATGIDEDVAGLFAGAFAQLPQKVIWKLNGKPSATLTPNVKVVDWIPQNDLLGHPQIKAFVYHCGVNGVWEAVYHGVPMVAVPLFGDQYDNAQRLVSRGMAVKVDISTLTSDELAQAIRTVIKDPSYKNNATRISAIFRDSPRTPPEVAVDWIEYVIRHGGAKHLRSAALDLNIFQYLLLDVIAVLLLAFITLMIILYCSCRLCFRGCRRLCGGSNKVKSE
ncbi:UDP-glucuronosyltransferase 2C1-like isoform X2 [Amphiura filiformis]|uniref:UDP-glucuronosyltransferase 2C1-like isoform X2 n=1 Tax=Amphiura filiformis TaxID=82378 RepID=UPI003B214A2C